MKGLQHRLIPAGKPGDKALSLGLLKGKPRHYPYCRFIRPEHNTKLSINPDFACVRVILSGRLASNIIVDNRYAKDVAAYSKATQALPFEVSRNNQLAPELTFSKTICVADNPEITI